MKRNICSRWPINIRHRIMKSYEPKSSFLLQKDSKIKKSEDVSTCRVKLSANGVNAFSSNALMVSKINQCPGDRGVFSPKVVMAVKALACELPSKRGLPFSWLSHADIAREAVQCSLLHRSAAPLFGDGSVPKRLNPGITAVGYFHGILTLSQRLNGYLIFIIAAWSRNPLSQMTVSLVPMN